MDQDTLLEVEKLWRTENEARGDSLLRSDIVPLPVARMYGYGSDPWNVPCSVTGWWSTYCLPIACLLAAAGEIFARCHFVLRAATRSVLYRFEGRGTRLVRTSNPLRQFTAQQGGLGRRT